MSPYANRWGGPRYRTEELAKFLNKHLYNQQEDQLRRAEIVNMCLAHDAFVGSRHTPLYPAAILNLGEWTAWRIKDELGFEAVFAKGTEILVYRDEEIKFIKIEDIKPGDMRVINFERVDEFKNDKMHHHLALTENFLSIKCDTYDEIQMLLCDGITAMTILRETDSIVYRVDQFNSENSQEVYFVEVTEVENVENQQFFYMYINPFSYSLKKNRNLSNPSGDRVYKHRLDTTGQRWLEKMRSKVFAMKKDNIPVKMELKHVKD
jgi:hypothetical protein